MRCLSKPSTCSNRLYYCSGPGRPQREEGEEFNCEDEVIQLGLEHDSPSHVCPFCTEQDHRYLRPDNLKRHVRGHHVGVDENDPHLRKALFLPQAGPCGRRNEEKKSWEAQFNEALSSDDLDTIRHLVASNSSKLNNYGRDSVYLPIEASIACDNVSVSMLLIDHGALTHRIRLEKLGLDLLIANMASIRPHLTFHEDYKYVRKAFVIKTHFEKVGREQFDPLTRFRVAAIAGLSYAVAEYIGEGGVHIEGYEGYRALSIAARLRHIDVVRTLLDGGTPVNLKSRCSDAIYPPIYWAIERGDYEMAELLLSRGAQTERQYCPDGAKCTMAGHEDYNSLISTLPTALQLAVLKRDKSMADSLIIFGADVCAPPMAENSEFYPLLWGKTTLEIALKVEPHYDTHLIQVLLEAGADINTPKFDTSMGSKDDKKVRMRLMYAKSGSSSFVQAAAWKWNHYALYQSPRDADFNGVSPRGFTALHMLFMDRTHFLRNDWLSSFKNIWFLLTSRGAEINNPQSVPLISAVVTCLLHEGLRFLKETKREILDFLIRQGLVCDDPRALGMAIVRKDTWLLRKLMEIAVEDPHLEHAALVVAVKMRYRPAVEILLQRSESVAQQCTVEAFNAACSMTSQSLIRLLVSRGVSVQEAEVQDSCRPSIHETEGRILIWCPEYDIMHSGRVESEDSDLPALNQRIDWDLGRRTKEIDGHRHDKRQSRAGQQ
ncbi:ankyrin repeat-containing domain protein [Phyllosticta capitalensis]